MKHIIPNSPFATHLSGSAKEVKLRLNNIFLWKKKRPPVVMLVLAAGAALFCGSLVSCQGEREELPESGDITSVSEELTAASEQYNKIASKIQMTFFKAERTLWQEPMEGLTEKQKELLENLPVDELPKQAVELYGLYYEDVWRDTLIPMAADEEADVTLYGVINAKKLFEDDPVSRAVEIRTVDGVVLRAGDQAAYYPLRWENIVYFGDNPLMLVRDFDGDGKAEAAVCLRAEHGTGINMSNLYFFDLDTMTYTVPDYSAFGEIEVEYDPAANTATLTSAADHLTVDVPDYWETLWEGECGNIVCFYEQDGQIYCGVGLDFRNTVGYLACATAPVIWQEGGYCLGEITLIDCDYQKIF